MPARSTSFQRLITAVHACSISKSKISESAMLRDFDTGESREVDILIASEESEYELLIGIEVVEWTRMADVPWVEKMIQKHQRLPTNKLVLISKSGFTKPAKKKANAHGVEAVELETALNINWDLATKLIGGGYLELLDISWKCMILPSGATEWIVPKYGDLILLPEMEGSIQVGVFSQNLVNLPLTGKTIFNHIEKNTMQEFHIIFSQKGLKYESQNQQKIAIDEVCINMEANESSTPFEFSTKSLKGSLFGVGESKDTQNKLCFAIKKGINGETSGAIYDNKKIKMMKSYS